MTLFEREQALSPRPGAVEPTGARALACGAPVDAPSGSVAADALAPRRAGELTFKLATAFVDEVVLVDDEAIIDVQRALWEQLRVIAEPAAAVGVAALRVGAYRSDPTERVAVVITGANTVAHCRTTPAC